MERKKEHPFLPNIPDEEAKDLKGLEALELVHQVPRLDFGILHLVLEDSVEPVLSPGVMNPVILSFFALSPLSLSSHLVG